MNRRRGTRKLPPSPVAALRLRKIIAPVAPAVACNRPPPAGVDYLDNMVKNGSVIAAQATTSAAIPLMLGVATHGTNPAMRYSGFPHDRALQRAGGWWAAPCGNFW